MKINNFGQPVLSESDLCDLIMKGRDVTAMRNVVVDRNLDLERLITHLEDPSGVMLWKFSPDSEVSVPQFDQEKQAAWSMPQNYRDLDIAQHLLDLCETQDQLQRVGQELLMFQERNLFDLLRYMKYLVDVMRENRVIWGLGRGSSVASYVLYLLGVHRIDSMHYDLDPAEFLR
jgi:hypothetical protein